jgi:hydrogenase/urease accessory protein HupE
MRWQEWSGPYETSGRRPTWWALYLIAALLVAVVGSVEAYVDGVVLRKILETITIAAGFGSICVWLHVNRIAFDLDKGRRRG